MKPVRIQLSRRKGWRMPPNTVKVDRRTKWGNPFRLGDHYLSIVGTTKLVHDAAEAVRLFRAVAYCRREEIEAGLRGKNLACWCPLDQPCHADVLLELANK